MRSCNLCQQYENIGGCSDSIAEQVTTSEEAKVAYEILEMVKTFFNMAEP